jgi:hypothetical protein
MRGPRCPARGGRDDAGDLGAPETGAPHDPPLPALALISGWRPVRWSGPSDPTELGDTTRGYSVVRPYNDREECPHAIEDQVNVVLRIAAVWFALSVPVSVIVARVIALGSHEYGEENAMKPERQRRRSLRQRHAA